ncbi:MAG TPA: hypothetical protein VMP13_05605 [Acidimicrobiia bacterium]|nr:hypothetical protein [Acidimicrobiia bacterium]
MPDEPAGTGGPILQTCPACGVSFDHDVPECPDCGERIPVSRVRIVIVVIAIVLVLAFLAAMWGGVTPISPDF